MNGRQVAEAARVNRPELERSIREGVAENAAVGNRLLDAGMEDIATPVAVRALENDRGLTRQICPAYGPEPRHETF